MDLNKPIVLPWAKDAQKEAAEFVPSPPRVNLVPSSVPERAAAQRAKRVGVTLVAVTALAVGGMYGLGWMHQGDVRSTLTVVTGQQAQATNELSVYSPVTNLASQTSALTATVNEQTRGQLQHSEVYSHFVTALGSVGHLTSLSLATGAQASGCATTDPFSNVTLAGCLSFVVTTPLGSAGAAQLISQLSADPWFVGAFIPSIGQGTDGATSLSGTVGVSQTAAAAAPNTAPTAAATEGTGK